MEEMSSHFLSSFSCSSAPLSFALKKPKRVVYRDISSSLRFRISASSTSSSRSIPSGRGQPNVSVEFVEGEFLRCVRARGRWVALLDKLRVGLKGGLNMPPEVDDEIPCVDEVSEETEFLRGMLYEDDRKWGEKGLEIETLEREATDFDCRREFCFLDFRDLDRDPDVSLERNDKVSLSTRDRTCRFEECGTSRCSRHSLPCRRTSMFAGVVVGNRRAFCFCRRRTVVASKSLKASTILRPSSSVTAIMLRMSIAVDRLSSSNISRMGIVDDGGSP